LRLEKKITAAFIDYQSKSGQNGGFGQPLTTGRSPCFLREDSPSCLIAENTPAILQPELI
jgi:hypothetical protein